MHYTTFELITEDDIVGHINYCELQVEFSLLRVAFYLRELLNF